MPTDDIARQLLGNGDVARIGTNINIWMAMLQPPKVTSSKVVAVKIWSYWVLFRLQVVILELQFLNISVAIVINLIEEQ